MGGRMSPTSDRPNPSMNNMMKEAQRNYRGSFIQGSLGGVKVSNPSSVKYYGREENNAMRTDFDVRPRFAKGGMPPRNKKNFRPTKAGAGMTRAGVKAYRRLNPVQN